MSKRLAIFLLTLLFQTGSFAESSNPIQCRTSAPGFTPAGKVYSRECGNRTEIYLNDKLILADDEQLFPNESSKDSLIAIYSGGTRDPVTTCRKSLYLLDFSKKPGKVISFGVKNACSNFEWVSWGTKRSVIALVHNVRFIYENGRMIPPKGGEDLWVAIESGHGDPVDVDSITPFVKELPVPAN